MYVIVAHFETAAKYRVDHETVISEHPLQVRNTTEELVKTQDASSQASHQDLFICRCRRKAN
jgi:hypothetical protein